MKRKIAKWLMQAVLSLLFALLLIAFLQFLSQGRWSWNRGGWILLICLPISSTLGIVFGDLAISKERKLSCFAIIITYCLGLIGLYFGVAISDPLGQWVFCPDHVFRLAVVIYSATSLGLIVPALIGYNTMSFLIRKARKKRL